MKKIILIFLLALPFSGITNAQNTINQQRMMVGLQLNQYQRDFGMGFNLTSPWFANRQIAIRARGNLMFYEHPDNDETTWTPYINTTLGVVGKTGNVGDFIRLYGEGGVIGLFPSDEFSSKRFELGGYGLFGFEFFMNPRANYFIEIGSAGAGAKADRIPNVPIYSNGLTISTGFRLHL